MLSTNDDTTDYVSQLMTRLLATLRATAAPAFADLDLTVPAARTLVILLRHGPMRVSQLAELVGLDTTGLSHLMRALEPRRLIARDRLPEDHRAVCASLTPRGVALAHSCDQVYQRIEGRLVHNLPEAEVTNLRALLGQIMANASMKDEPRGSRPARQAGTDVYPADARALLPGSVTVT
jgi:DNA-binding MarR family transcriptional regulator